MECPRCGSANPAGKRFCAECGAPLPTRCTACGAENPPGNKFCGDCGAALTRTSTRAPATAPLNPLTAASPPSPPPHSASSSAAERRQLTVMFCDLVDSTSLSSRLDPEDLREIISAYRRCMRETVSRFDGFIAKYMGDGVLIYFGYPQAHEDDAERAVRAGLALVEAVGRLDVPERLQVRVGLATGLVIVGDLIGAGAAQEQAVVGETPNLAARLQAMAEPDNVIVAASTRRLTSGLFEYRDLGAVEAKGFAGPVRAWRVLRPCTIENRFEAQHSEIALTPLVGREREMELLLRQWQRAKNGDEQVVLLTGEPGIGKSRIAAALQAKLATEPHTHLRYFCSPYDQDSALRPVIAQLECAARFERDDAPETKLDKLEALLAPTCPPAEDVALLADLLSIATAHRYQPLDLIPQRKKERTFEALLRQLDFQVRQWPLLIVYEDVHWIDPSSRELLDLVVERIRCLPVLLVVTFRPEFQLPRMVQSHVTVVVLSRLDQREGVALVERVIGDEAALPAAVIEEIVARTDGVPLFLEEVTKAVLDAAGARNACENGIVAAPEPAHTVPATLNASLMARLDRLHPVAKELAQIGAAIGREFSYELLGAVAQQPIEKWTEALRQLAEAGLIFERGMPPQATYTFKHALVQDAAYGTLLRAARRQLHARIAAALEDQLPELVQAQPELLAHHLTEAGLFERAIVYWHEAGRRSMARFATKEATAHLTKGIELLAKLPPGRLRGEREIELRLALAVPLIALHGYGSAAIEACAARAKQLCDELDNHPIRFAVYRVVWNSCLARQPVPRTVALAREVMALARASRDPAQLAVAHRALAYSLHIAGEHLQADKLFIEAVKLADGVADAEFAVYGEHPGMICRTYSSITRCVVGFLDQGTRLADAAVEHARARNSPVGLAWALVSGGFAHALRRDAVAIERLAREAIAVSREHRLPQWLAFAQIIFGVALCWRGDPQAGIELQEEGMQRLLALGSMLHTTRTRLHLAESFLGVGELEAARAHLAAGHRHREAYGEDYFAAELQRTEALLLQAEGMSAEVIEQHLDTALRIARSQGARLLELRAATNLGRLWHEQGKRSAARDLLAPIYGWFTEGFDTLDLKEAKALLDGQT